MHLHETHESHTECPHGDLPVQTSVSIWPTRHLLSHTRLSRTLSDRRGRASGLWQETEWEWGRPLPDLPPQCLAPSCFLSLSLSVCQLEVEGDVEVSGESVELCEKGAWVPEWLCGAEWR